jgi:hypothetical protein
MLLSMNVQLQWLNLDNNHELLWDGSMCEDTSRGAVIRDLVEKACKGPLAPAQQEVLSAILFSQKRMIVRALSVLPFILFCTLLHLFVYLNIFKKNRTKPFTLFL